MADTHCTCPSPDPACPRCAVAAASAELASAVTAHDLAPDLRYDLHAILMGQATLGAYTPRQRSIARLALGMITSEQLTELIGPPVRD